MSDDYYSPYRQYGSAWNMARTDAANVDQGKRIFNESTAAAERASKELFPDLGGPVGSSPSQKTVIDLSVPDEQHGWLWLNWPYLVFWLFVGIGILALLF